MCDEQDLYDNSVATATLFKARTGTLKDDILMVIHIVKYNTNATEDIEHFLLDCEIIYHRTTKNIQRK